MAKNTIIDRKIDWDHYYMPDPNTYNITGPALDPQKLLDRLFKENGVVAMGETHHSEPTQDLIAKNINRHSPDFYFKEGVDHKKQKKMDADRENWFYGSGDLDKAIMSMKGRVIAADKGTESYFSDTKRRIDYFSLVVQAEYCHNLANGKPEEIDISAMDDFEKEQLLRGLKQEEGIEHKIYDDKVIALPPSRSNTELIQKLAETRDLCLEEADKLRKPVKRELDERTGDNTKSNNFSSDIVAKTYKQFVKEHGEVPSSIINFGNLHFTAEKDFDEMVAAKLKKAGIDTSVATVSIVPTDNKNYIGKAFKNADDINKAGEEFVVFVSSADLKENGHEECKINYIDPKTLPPKSGQLEK